VEPPIIVDISLVQVAPALQLGLNILNSAAAFYGLPFPFQISNKVEQMNMMQSFIQSVLEDTAKKLLLPAVSTTTTSPYMEPINDTQVQALVGVSYNLICEKAAINKSKQRLYIGKPK
jgi:hypothetical protein